jgi:CHASE3 domain sensor protein
MKGFAMLPHRFCGSITAGSVVDMNSLRGPLAAPGSSAMEIRIPGFGLNSPMSSQRLLLGIGFAILLAISAASIALDVKSRSDVAWINHTLEVSNKLTDMRLLFRRTESAARGYLLASDQSSMEDYHRSLDRIAPAFAELKEALKDNPAQLRLLANSEPLVVGRFAVTSKMILLHAAGDSAGLAALTVKAEGRALMDSIGAHFDQIAEEEQRLLGIRSAESKRTGSLLLAVDLSCTALILILAVILMREGRRSSRKLEHYAPPKPPTNRLKPRLPSAPSTCLPRTRSSGIRRQCLRVSLSAWRRQCWSSTTRARSFSQIPQPNGYCTIARV